MRVLCFNLNVQTYDNYLEWKVRIQATLKQRRLWEETEPGYEEEITRKMREKDFAARNVLVQCVENHYLNMM